MQSNADPPPEFHIYADQKIETFTTEFAGFVKITSDTGDSGWGQVSTYHSDITAMVLHRQVAPYALGQDAMNIYPLVTRITEHEHKFPGSYSSPRPGRTGYSIMGFTLRIE